MSTDATIALVTLADARLYCGKVVGSETEDDPVIEMLIDGVSGAFNAYVGRRIVEYTETTAYVDGNGRETIQLPRWPVTSIATVTEDDTDLTEGDDEDYRLYGDEGLLRRLGEAWMSGRKKIKLTSYRAGYMLANLPKDLKFAALKQIAAELKDFRMRTQGEISRTAPDGSVTKRESGQFLPEVKAALDRYRDIRI
jgi:hypothetical protein